MVNGLTVAIGTVAVLAAAYAGLRVLRNRLTDIPLLVGCGVLEVLLLGQLVVGIVALAMVDRPVSTPVFVGYLLTALLVLPVGLTWGLLEHSRWGPAVVGAACLVILVLLGRLNTVWVTGA